MIPPPPHQFPSVEFFAESRTSCLESIEVARKERKQALLALDEAAGRLGAQASAVGGRVAAWRADPPLSQSSSSLVATDLTQLPDEGERQVLEELGRLVAVRERLALAESVVRARTLLAAALAKVESQLSRDTSTQNEAEDEGPDTERLASARTMADAIDEARQQLDILRPHLPLQDAQDRLSAAGVQIEHIVRQHFESAVSSHDAAGARAAADLLRRAARDHRTGALFAGRVLASAAPLWAKEYEAISGETPTSDEAVALLRSMHRRLVDLLRSEVAWLKEALPAIYADGDTLPGLAERLFNAHGDRFRDVLAAALPASCEGSEAAGRIATYCDVWQVALDTAMETTEAVDAAVVAAAEADVDASLGPHDLLRRRLRDAVMLPVVPAPETHASLEQKALVALVDARVSARIVARCATADTPITEALGFLPINGMNAAIEEVAQGAREATARAAQFGGDDRHELVVDGVRAATRILWTRLSDMALALGSIAIALVTAMSRAAEDAAKGVRAGDSQAGSGASSSSAAAASVSSSMSAVLGGSSTGSRAGRSFLPEEEQADGDKAAASTAAAFQTTVVQLTSTAARLLEVAAKAQRQAPEVALTSATLRDVLATAQLQARIAMQLALAVPVASSLDRVPRLRRWTLATDGGTPSAYAATIGEHLLSLPEQLASLGVQDKVLLPSAASALTPSAGELPLSAAPKMLDASWYARAFLGAGAAGGNGGLTLGGGSRGGDDTEGGEKEEEEQEGDDNNNNNNNNNNTSNTSDSLSIPSHSIVPTTPTSLPTGTSPPRHSLPTTVTAASSSTVSSVGVTVRSGDRWVAIRCTTDGGLQVDGASTKRVRPSKGQPRSATVGPVWSTIDWISSMRITLAPSGVWFSEPGARLVQQRPVQIRPDPETLRTDDESGLTEAGPDGSLATEVGPLTAGCSMGSLGVVLCGADGRLWLAPRYALTHLVTPPTADTKPFDVGSLSLEYLGRYTPKPTTRRIAVTACRLSSSTLLIGTTDGTVAVTRCIALAKARRADRMSTLARPTSSVTSSCLRSPLQGPVRRIVTTKDAALALVLQGMPIAALGTNLAASRSGQDDGRTTDKTAVLRVHRACSGILAGVHSFDAGGGVRLAVLETRASAWRRPARLPFLPVGDDAWSVADVAVVPEGTVLGVSGETVTGHDPLLVLLLNMTSPRSCYLALSTLSQLGATPTSALYHAPDMPPWATSLPPMPLATNLHGHQLALITDAAFRGGADDVSNDDSQPGALAMVMVAAEGASLLAASLGSSAATASPLSAVGVAECARLAAADARPSQARGTPGVTLVAGKGMLDKADLADFLAGPDGGPLLLAAPRLTWQRLLPYPEPPVLSSPPLSAWSFKSDADRFAYWGADTQSADELTAGLVGSQIEMMRVYRADSKAARGLGSGAGGRGGAGGGLRGAGGSGGHSSRPPIPRRRLMAAAAAASAGRARGGGRNKARGGAAAKATRDLTHTELQALREPVPPYVFAEVHFDERRAGTAFFEHASYNAGTSVTGLENTLPLASTTNALVQLLAWQPAVRAVLSSHVCMDEDCLRCELRFLAEDLVAAKGSAVCSSARFLRVLSAVPELEALQLHEGTDGTFGETMERDTLPRRLSLLFRVLVRQLGWMDSWWDGRKARFLRGKVPPNASSSTPVTSIRLRTALVCDRCKREQARPKEATALDVTDASVATFAESIARAVSATFTSRAYCEACAAYRMSHGRTEPALPSGDRSGGEVHPSWLPWLLTLTPSHDVATSLLARRPAAIPSTLTVDLETGAVETPSSDRRASSSANVRVYQLHGIVSTSWQKEEVPGASRRGAATVHVRDEAGAWVAINDFTCVPSSEESARSACSWKTPVLIVYTMVERGGPTKRTTSGRGGGSAAAGPTPTPVSSLYPTASVPLGARDALPFPGEREAPGIPQAGTVVALDAEFVSLAQEETHVRADGSRALLSPAHFALGRVSATTLRAWRHRSSNSLLLASTPLLDDFLVQTTPVVDYLTKWSGLTPDMLDPSSPSRSARLCMPKATYLKLRALRDARVVFAGHGLDKDFRIANLFVPADQVLDSALLFHDSSFGRRHLSLRFLSLLLNGHRIQMKEQEGHDSVVDAESAGEVILRCVDLGCKGALVKEALRVLHRRGRSCGFDPELLRDSDVTAVQDELARAIHAMRTKQESHAPAEPTVDAPLCCWPVVRMVRGEPAEEGAELLDLLAAVQAQ